MANLIGQVRGNYRLTQLLGRGGFAEVYLAEHIYLSNKAAIKLLNDSLDEEGSKQFQQEALTLKKLEHPHIIKILDFGFDWYLPLLAAVIVIIAGIGVFAFFIVCTRE